jgi:hypothetical protein
MDYHEKSQNWTAVCEYVDHGLELYTAETSETPSNGLLCGQKYYFKNIFSGVYALLP